MKKLLTILLILAFISCRKDIYEKPIPEQKSFKEPNTAENKTKKKYQDGTLLVQWTNGVMRSTSMNNVHGKFLRHVQTPLMKRHGNHGFDIISVDNVDSAIAKLKNDPFVATNYLGHKMVAPRYFSYTQQTTYPNDSLYVAGAMWGMAACNAPVAWNSGNKGDMSIIIADVDQGVFLAHHDLCTHVWKNTREIPNNGIDDDGNGYIDDIYGWNWFDNSATIVPGFHAIHTAGTIGAIGNNNIGVIGVAPNVTLMCLQFIGNDGYGYNDAAVAAWDYATYQREVFHENVVGTSNSWGYQGNDPFVEEAAQRAAAANIVVVCAAGNSAENDDINPMYPGAYSTPTNNVLTVAAEDQSGGMAYFSNYSATKVDIGAPGTNIWSLAFTSDFHDSYASHSGTSMATPHVAGAVALYCAGHPGATYTQIKNAIVSSATPNAAFNGKVRSNGVLNVSSFAYQTPETQPQHECPVIFIDSIPPTTPQNVHNTANGFSSTSFAWNKSTDVGSNVKEYWVYVGWPNGNNVWITTDTFITVNAFVDPTDVMVQAVDVWNNMSGYSNVAEGHPIIDHEAPTSPAPLTSTAYDSTSIINQWTQSTDNSGIITKYRVKWFVQGQTSGFQVDLANGFFTYQITGLQPATTYLIKVTAFDPTGNESLPATATVTTGGVGNGDSLPPPPPPPQVPAAPTGFSFSNPTLSSLDASWNSVSNETGYKVYWRKVGLTNYDSATITTVSFTVSGLDSSTTYEGFVRAFNAVGNSAASNSAQGTTLSPQPPPPPPPPPPPTASITLTGFTSGAIHNLNWVVANSQNTNCELQKKDKGNWITIDVETTSPASFSYNPNSTKPITYRVHQIGASLYSNQVQLKSGR